VNLLMVAPPGAGKGTQAKRLADHYDIEHISSAEIFRQQVAADTPVGREVRGYLERGDLVPDDVVLVLVAERAVAAAAAGGYVLDGYPRNLAQAERAREVAQAHPGVELDAVIHLRVEREALLARMVARSRRDSRTDDTLATMEHILDVFAEQTAPLLDYYAERGLLIAIEGEGAVAEITATIIGHLDLIHAGA